MSTDEAIYIIKSAQKEEQPKCKLAEEALERGRKHTLPTKQLPACGPKHIVSL